MSKHTWRPAVCEHCGGSYMVRKDRRNPRFCTNRCSADARRGSTRTGGVSFDRDSGRWKIMCRDGTQVWFYRAVMEAHLGRPLAPHELVHHKNEDPSDDRIENLVLTTRADHARHHTAKQWREGSRR